MSGGPIPSFTLLFVTRRSGGRDMARFHANVATRRVMINASIFASIFARVSPLRNQIPLILWAARIIFHTAVLQKLARSHISPLYYSTALSDHSFRSDPVCHCRLLLRCQCYIWLWVFQDSFCGFSIIGEIVTIRVYWLIFSFIL